jgi:orotidine-5'-phosphate decarboxylase
MMHSPFIVALDMSTEAEVKRMLGRLSPTLCRVKVGKELFTNLGPKAIHLCHKAGYEVFLDLKFHDIPNTCAQAVKAAARHGVWMVNVHAAGGPIMLAAAKEALAGFDAPPKLIAVTVLTSMSQPQLSASGCDRSIADQVSFLADLTQQAGLDGVVCSAEEASRLRLERGSEFCLVTPGIRPEAATLHDQTRVVTPKQAMTAGAHYLVVGRPVTASADPREELTRLINDLV